MVVYRSNDEIVKQISFDFLAVGPTKITKVFKRLLIGVREMENK